MTDHQTHVLSMILAACSDLDQATRIHTLGALFRDMDHWAAERVHLAGKAAKVARLIHELQAEEP